MSSPSSPPSEVTSQKHRVLFVDDDPVFLRTLERMTHSIMGWRTMSVTSGKAALRALRAQRFDLIISDIDMPEMNGNELLTKVKAHYPEVVRVHLTGSCSAKTGIAAVPVAHQFHDKTLFVGRFTELLERTATLRELLVSEPLRRLVGESDELPAVPSVYAELTSCLASSTSTFRDIARIVSLDQSLTASILKLVNSAFFGSPKHVSNITEATAFLGITQIRELVLTVGVIEAFKDAGNLPGFSIEYLQRHGLLTALIARHLDTSLNEDETSLAGMLHELGQLILASRCPSLYKDVLEASQERPLHEVEEEILGVTHAEVGAYLLGLWGLPVPVVTAVAHHHDPSRAGADSLDMAHAVYVADHLATELEGPRAGVNHSQHGDIDLGILEKIGAEGRLDSWRLEAGQFAERATEEPPTSSVGEEQEERRQGFRVKISSEHPITVTIGMLGSAAKLSAKNLSVSSSDRPGGMLLKADATTVPKLPLERWSDGTIVPMAVTLPDGAGTIVCDGRITGAIRPSERGALCFAVQYKPDLADRDAIYRVWLEAQRRMMESHT